MSARFSTDSLKFPVSKPALLDPADDNLCEGGQKMFGKVGLAIVVIQVNSAPKNLATDFYNAMGESMSRSNLGCYDSSKWQPKWRHYFHIPTARLMEAMNFMILCLPDLGVLEHLTIGYYDATDEVWRAFSHGVT